MRIKLSHLIIASLISSSVVFSAVSSASAGFRGSSILGNTTSASVNTTGGGPLTALKGSNISTTGGMKNQNHSNQSSSRIVRAPVNYGSRVGRPVFEETDPLPPTEPPFPIPPETKPNSPGVLEMNWKDDTSVVLSWQDRSLVETGFRVEQQAVDGNWVFVEEFGPLEGKLNYHTKAFEGLIPEAKYCFRVVAYNDIGKSSRKICSSRLLADVLELARKKGDYVLIDHDLNLKKSDIVTKVLIFAGAKASGVTLNCNGATIQGGLGTFNYGKDMIEVKSIYNAKDRKWERPQNVTIKNCNITGSVRVKGMENIAELKELSRSARYVETVRERAPNNIVFDNIIITGVGRNPLYFAVGVTYSTLINSEIKGKSDAVAIYLDAESYGNTIKNNYIHVNVSHAVIGIDGSSYNKIMNNRLSGLNHGGIYLYRNCGERGVVRHQTPSHNQIINNTFYYNEYKGRKPAVYLGSRNGRTRKGKYSYCGDDEFTLESVQICDDYDCHYEWKRVEIEGGNHYGSSVSNLDFARHNVVMQNQFYKRQILKQGSLGQYLTEASFDDMIKTKNPSINKSNHIGYNRMVTKEDVKEGMPAGCYVESGNRGFISHGQSFDAFGPQGNDYKYTCNNGDLIRRPSSRARQETSVFEYKYSTSTDKNTKRPIRRPVIRPAEFVILR